LRPSWFVTLLIAPRCSPESAQISNTRRTGDSDGLDDLNPEFFIAPVGKLMSGHVRCPAGLLVQLATRLVTPRWLLRFRRQVRASCILVQEDSVLARFRDTYWIRKQVVVAIAAMLLASVCLSACDTNDAGPVGQAGTTAGSSATSQPTSPASEPTTTEAPSYQYIGEITLPVPQGSGGGVETIAYSIGSPIVSENPPAEATDIPAACDQTYQGSGTNVWVPGQITVRAQAGPYAAEIGIAGGDIVGSDVYDGAVAQGGADLTNGLLAEAVESGGQWSCGEDSGGTDSVDSGSPTFDVSLKSGQAATFPIWVVGFDVVDNSAPTFSAAMNIDWIFNGFTSLSGENLQISSVSGPHAVQCSTPEYTGSVSGVSLFGTPPFTYRTTIIEGDETTSPGPIVTCRAA
jgi:predicted small secreted protein